MARSGRYFFHAVNMSPSDQQRHIEFKETSTQKKQYYCNIEEMNRGAVSSSTEVIDYTDINMSLIDTSVRSDVQWSLQQKQKIHIRLEVT